MLNVIQLLLHVEQRAGLYCALDAAAQAVLAAAAPGTGQTSRCKAQLTCDRRKAQLTVYACRWQASTLFVDCTTVTRALTAAQAQ